MTLGDGGQRGLVVNLLLFFGKDWLLWLLIFFVGSFFVLALLIVVQTDQGAGGVPQFVTLLQLHVFLASSTFSLLLMLVGAQLCTRHRRVFGLS